MYEATWPYRENNPHVAGDPISGVPDPYIVREAGEAIQTATEAVADVADHVLRMRNQTRNKRKDMLKIAKDMQRRKGY